MASLRPFFSPSNRGFHPHMSHCLLLAAAEYKVSEDMCYLDIISNSYYLREIGQCLPNNQLPVRTWEEISEELLRIRSRWQRVSELKKVEAALRQTEVVYDLPVVRFDPLEHKFWAERWPNEIEFLNKEIPDYHLMKTFFGGFNGVSPNNLTADEIRRWIEQGCPELQVITIRHPASCNIGSCKDKSSGSSKAGKRKAKSSGSSKAIVEENSDDDFM